MAVVRHAVKDRSTLGVALLDVSTGDFSATEYVGADGQQAFADELMVLRPREVVVPVDVQGLDLAARQRAVDGEWPQLADAGVQLVGKGELSLPGTEDEKWQTVKSLLKALAGWQAAASRGPSKSHPAVSVPPTTQRTSRRRSSAT